MAKPTEVYVESGPKRVFASAVAWPGWSRGARSEDEALEALLGVAGRYAAVARRAGISFAAPRVVKDLRVVERLTGGASTDFGIPSLPAAADGDALSAAERKRQRSLLEAAWATFDDAARAATGLELRTGPRGGGRPLEKMVTHVAEADGAYLHQLGSRAPKVPARASVEERLAALREAGLAAFEDRARDEPPADPNRVKKPWLARYYVRRSAWHALDHAWEIQDRAIRD